MKVSSVSCTAFNGSKRIASGSLREVVLKAKELLDRDQNAQLLIFDDATSELIEADFRGTSALVASRIDSVTSDAGTVEPPVLEGQAPDLEARRPGRPKLGVVAREVTLLPRHWDWLASQPGGASVALRKLVEHAMKANRSRDTVRRAQESAYRFMSAMAGNEPMYEEAIRALFGGQPAQFHGTVELWPADVRDHAKKLAVGAFTDSATPT